MSNKVQSGADKKPPKIIVTGSEIETAAAMAYTYVENTEREVVLGRLLTGDPVFKGGGICRYYSKNEIEKIFMNRQFIYLNEDTGLTTFAFEDSDIFAVPLWDIPLLPQKIFNRNAVYFIYIGVHPKQCVKITEYTRERALNDDMKRQICATLDSHNSLYIDYEDYNSFYELVENIFCSD